MHSVAMVAQGAEIVGAGGAPDEPFGRDAPDSRRLASVAVASLVLLVVGAGLLWIAQADAVFLDTLSAGLPGCF